jgi:pyridinium-3,5-bisthiocarboxylic acid mononucleotide nickel chelatase
MAKTAYFDLLSGASGDMILGALVDLGVPIAYLQRELGRMGIPGLKISVARTRRHGILCNRMKMSWETPKTYRHLPDILRLIKKGRFDPAVYTRCEAVLDRLAAAEAKAHGIPKSEVHFHEIGAVDTIIDIVGACLGFDYLKIDDIYFSTLTEGHGTISAEHGTMPVQAPATANLMQGFHATTLNIPTELLTPTGCALLTSLGAQSLSCPAGRIERIGYGCGAKEFEHHPNYLRAFLVETADPSVKQTGRDVVTVLETDMDHLSGEVLGNVGGLLMELGALDVSWTPIYMKKGRPAYRCTVIAQPEKAGELAETIMVHTRTLGVRLHNAERIIAERESKAVRFLGREISEKRGSYKGRTFTKPEYEDLAAISRDRGLPIIELMELYAQDKGRSAKK